MNQLQQKIKFLEMEIATNKFLLREEGAKLYHYMHSTKFLSYFLVGGFTVGFMTGRAIKPASQTEVDPKSKFFTMFQRYYSYLSLALPLLMR
jgi:hypothetical protein